MVVHCDIWNPLWHSCIACCFAAVAASPVVAAVAIDVRHARHSRQARQDTAKSKAKTTNAADDFFTESGARDGGDSDASLHTYKVEKILDKTGEGGSVLYLVKWKGYEEIWSSPKQVSIAGFS